MATTTIGTNLVRQHSSGSARASEAHHHDVATRLDMRLLSYLIAYVACQLPALPALVDLHGNHSAVNPLAADDDNVYLTRQETDPLVALRVLTSSGQGLLNALVFAHHAHHCGHRRWEWPWFRMRDLSDAA